MPHLIIKATVNFTIVAAVPLMLATVFCSTFGCPEILNFFFLLPYLFVTYGLVVPKQGS